MAIRMRRGGEGLLRCGERSELFDTAEPDSVSFSEGPVNGSRFGNTHLGAANHGGCVGGVGIAVADEAFRATGRVHSSLKNPSTGDGIALSLLQYRTNSEASSARSYSKQPRMRDVPSPVKAQNLARGKGETKGLGQLTQCC